jgi:hypothetical protein
MERVLLEDRIGARFTAHDLRHDAGGNKAGSMRLEASGR